MTTTAAMSELLILRYKCNNKQIGNMTPTYRVHDATLLGHRLHVADENYTTAMASASRIMKGSYPNSRKHTHAHIPGLPARTRLPLSRQLAPTNSPGLAPGVFRSLSRRAITPRDPPPGDIFNTYTCRVWCWDRSHRRSTAGPPGCRVRHSGNTMCGVHRDLLWLSCVAFCVYYSGWAPLRCNSRVVLCCTTGGVCVYPTLVFVLKHDVSHVYLRVSRRPPCVGRLRLRSHGRSARRKHRCAGSFSFHRVRDSR